MFLPDANTNPYPDPSSSSLSLSTSTSTSAPPIPISAARPSVKHSNTRLHEDDPTWTAAGGKNGEKSKGGSVRASSPSRSLIDAAVRGTPCKLCIDCSLPLFARRWLILFSFLFFSFFFFLTRHDTTRHDRPTGRHKPTAKYKQLPARPTRRLALTTRPTLPPHLGYTPRHPSCLGRWESQQQQQQR